MLLSVFNAVTDSVPPVGDHDAFPLGFGHPGLDVLYDIHDILKPGIVLSNHRQICQSAAYLAHLIPPGFRPVSSSAKHAYQTVRLIFPQCLYQGFQACRIMGIINQQGIISRHLNRLHSAFHLHLVQAVQNILLGYREMAAYRDGGDGVISAEFSRDIHVYAQLHCPGNVKMSP